jgi:GPH family glycoside/pentoside/hexuronide:cation symporter
MNRWQKIAFGVGSLGTAISYQSFSNQILYFYLAVMFMNPATMSILMFIYGVWNAINDPLMGRLSDGTHSKLGRRIPYVLFGTIPLALFYFLIWTPPQQASPFLLVLYFILTVFIFDTLWTLVVIAWTALMPEMWPDLQERAEVSGWREVFSLIGVLVGLGAAPIVIDRVGYVGMGIAFAVITAISFFVSLLGSREKPQIHAREESLPLIPALRTAFAIPSFRWFLIANLGKEFLFLVLVSMVPFYATAALMLRDIPGGLDAPMQQSLLLAVPFVLAIPGMYLWTKIAQRAGSLRGWIYASLALIPGLVVMFFAPDFTIGLIGTSLLALGLPGILMMYNLVISDVIDEDEVLNGQRREGFFFGMNGAIIRLAFSWQALLTGPVLIATGYNPALDVQPLSAQWGIRFLIVGLPVLGLLVTLWALSRYPLHGAALDAMREKMLAKHAAAERALAEDQPLTPEAA